jgi:hypothetical protein
VKQIVRTVLGFVAAHRASVHGRAIGKAATKQARTLELEFTLAPRSRDRLDGMQGGRRGGARQRTRHSEEESQGAVGADCDDARFDSSPIFRNAPNINTNCLEEFPTLGGEAPPVLGLPPKQNAHKVAVNNSGLTIQTIRQTQPLAVTDENFPALGPEGTASGCKTVRLSVNSGSQERPHSTTGASVRNSTQKAPTNVSIHVNHRASGSSQNIRIRPVSVPSQFHDDFPSLNGSKTPTPSSSVQWLCNQASTGAKSKVQPQLQTPKVYRTEEDFPSLNSKLGAGCNMANSASSAAVNPESVSKKASSVMIPLETVYQGSSSVTRTRELNAVSGKSSTDILDNTATSLGNIRIKSRKKKTKTATTHTSNNCSNDSVLTKPAQCAASESGKKKKKQGNAEAEAQQKLEQDTQSKDNGCENQENGKTAKSGDVTDNSSTFERKRSELLIESVTSQHSTENSKTELSGATNNKSCEDDDHSCSSEVLDDCTTLGSSESWPPGFDVPVSRGKFTPAPPPGFGGGVCTNSSSVTSPPPGFSVTLNSVARPQSSGLTFTSSSGQRYSILPGSSENSSHRFVPPQDFARRNQALVTRVKKTFADARSMDEFCQASKMFRQGQISARDFSVYCQEIMGSEEFAKIFPELLVLLPDIDKQQVSLKFVRCRVCMHLLHDCFSF